MDNYILRHIFLPQDRKQKKKDRKILLSYYQASEEETLLTSVDFNSQSDPVATGSALRPKSGRSEHKRERVCIRASGPILAGARKRKYMRTAKIGPDLRLSQCTLANRLSLLVLDSIR